MNPARRRVNWLLPTKFAAGSGYRGLCAGICDSCSRAARFSGGQVLFTRTALSTPDAQKANSIQFQVRFSISVSVCDTPAPAQVSGRMWPVKIESNVTTHAITGPAVISLSRWLEQVGVTTCTAWRRRKRGWLKTINNAGRQYLTQEAIDGFHRRACAGVFSQVSKVPGRNGPGLGN